MEPIIKLSNLSKKYQMSANVVCALDDVSFEVARGSIVSILGKSGSGKSTLLNLVGGLDIPTEGNVFINGQGLATMKRSELALHRRQTVGMVFQSFNLIPARNALENIMLALIFGRVPARQRKKRAEELLVSVGLGHRLTHKPGELSGGESQRVAIARALANNPMVLLADEPTGNLDSSTSSELIGLLQKLNCEKGLTILLVTHDQDTAKKISDMIINLKDGKVV